MAASNYVHIDDVKILKATDKAFHVEWEGERFWLPLSQIADADNYDEGDEHCNLSITEWIAHEKGIEVE